jgi:lariat debranching enzyme
VYHIRNLDVFRLRQLGRKPDVILSHDWPRGIHRFGDVGKLLRQKQFFKVPARFNKFSISTFIKLSISTF